MINLEPGIRVHTPYGQGVIAYVRMKPPDYVRPMVVSVMLDKHRGNPDYRGTIVASKLVYTGELRPYVVLQCTMTGERGWQSNEPDHSWKDEGFEVLGYCCTPDECKKLIDLA